MNQNFRRENYKQHKSEKLLDAFLFRAEKREAQKLQKELEFLKKRNEFIMHAKKRKLIEEQPKKSQEESKIPVSKSEEEDKEGVQKTPLPEEPKPKQCNNNLENHNPSVVDPYAALIKIVKYIVNPAKYSKCLSMLKELLYNCMEVFDAATIFTILDLLCWSPHKFKSVQDRAILRELFTSILEYSESNSPYFSSDQETLIEYYQIPAILHVQLFTDDSFQFNRVMSDLNGLLEELIHDAHLIDLSYTPTYEERHKTALDIIERKKDLRDKLANDPESVKEEEIERMADEYSYSSVKNIKGLAQYAKREFFFDCLRDIVPYAQKSWGKTSVVKLLKKAYVERKIFSEEEQEELGDMVSTATSKIALVEKRDMSKKYMDEKIRSNPSENYYRVEDGRSEVYGVGDLDEWSTRQFGLNPLKR